MIILSIKTTSRNLLFTCLMLVILTHFESCKNSAELTNDDFVQIVKRSNFFFAGTVIHKDSSNILIKIPGRMAIVRVDSVYDAVYPYYNQKGKEITVLFNDTNVLYSEGDQLMLHTSGWFYGENLGVIENANKFLILPDVKKRIENSRETIQSRFISDHLKEGDLIVTGKVLEVKRDTTKLKTLRSEHNPKLYSAQIKVNSVLKGSKKIKDVQVYFASSMDEFWKDSPKLVKGMEGIFVLKNGKENAVINQQEYFMFDQRSFQSQSDITKITQLLKN